MTAILVTQAAGSRGEEIAAGVAKRLSPASRAVLADQWQEAQQRSTPNESPAPLALEAIVNSSRVNLAGVTNNEQAIARIEEHLRGEKLSSVPRACSLPPAGLFG